MDAPLALRAGALQAGLVAVLFAVLVALPLPSDFFRDVGPLTGPVAWILCAAGTARILRLPLGPVMAAAAGAGLLAAVVGFALSHTGGLVVGIVAFGVLVGSGRLMPRSGAAAR